MIRRLNGHDIVEHEAHPAPYILPTHEVPIPNDDRTDRRLMTRLRGWLVLGLLGSVLATAATAKEIDVPTPQPGMWAPTALALLGYNKSICDGIAGRVLGHWNTLSGSPEERIASVQNRLLEDSLADLAAGRSASDIIRSFLDQARRETDSETGASLERLYELEKSLCDTVASPSDPLPEFEARLQRLLDQIEREEEELGRLLVVPDDQLRILLEPYLQPIQLAGFEAQNDYLDYLETLKPKPVEVTVQDKMVQWHRAYSHAVEPTKLALGRYLRARKDNDVRTMATACRDILKEVIPLLRRKEVFSPPKQMLPKSRGIQPQLLPPLRDAYSSLRTMATHCAAGRSREVVESLNEMQKNLQTSAAYLKPYAVTP